MRAGGSVPSAAPRRHRLVPGRGSVRSVRGQGHRRAGLARSAPRCGEKINARRGAKRAAVREEQRHGAAPRRTPDARGAPARARALSLPPALARFPRRGALRPRSRDAGRGPRGVAPPARRFCDRGSENDRPLLRVRCARARRERTPLAPTRVRTRARRSNARAPLERDAAATPPRARAGRDP